MRLRNYLPALLLTSLSAFGATPLAELPGYRTVTTAITTTLAKTNSATGQSGYLGLHVAPDPKGKLVIGEVAENSPAAKADAQAGDILLKLDRQPVASADALRDALQRKSPGEFAQLSVRRGSKSLDLLATLAATSRPRHVGEQRAIMGIRTGEVTDQGAPISAVTTGLPADKVPGI